MIKNFSKRLMIVVSAIVLMVSLVKADQKYVEFAKVTADTTKEEVLQFCEKMPEFPGGRSEMSKYLNAKLVYPAQGCVQGRVTLRFVVTKTGEIRDINVLRSVEPLLDAEAVRVVKAMPKWIPGTQDGKVVNVYYTLPVDFVFPNSEKPVGSAISKSVVFE